MMLKKRLIILTMSALALSGQMALSQDGAPRHSTRAPVTVQQVEEAIVAAQAAIDEAKTWADPIELRAPIKEVAAARRYLERGDLDEAMDSLEETVVDLEKSKANKAKHTARRS